MKLTRNRQVIDGSTSGIRFSLLVYLLIGLQISIADEPTSSDIEIAKQNLGNVSRDVDRLASEVAALPTRFNVQLPSIEVLRKQLGGDASADSGIALLAELVYHSSNPNQAAESLKVIAEYYDARQRSESAAYFYGQYLVKAVQTPVTEESYAVANRLLTLAISNPWLTVDTDVVSALRIGLASPDHHHRLSYMLGKYYFGKNDWVNATTAFAAIPSSSSDYWHAQYHLGSLLVRQDRYSAAIDYFEKLSNKLKDRGRLHETSKRISAVDLTDLTALALARLYTTQNNIASALESYSRIGSASRHFRDALFETAWLLGRCEVFDEAVKAIEQFMTHYPKDGEADELRLLYAVALQKLGKEQDALKQYEIILSRYREQRDQLYAAMSREKNNFRFFGELAVTSLPGADLALTLPQVVLKEAEGKPHNRRLLEVWRDLQEIKQDLSEVAESLTALDQIVQSSRLRQAIDSSIQQSREEMTRLFFSLLEIKNQVLEFIEKSSDGNIHGGNERGEISRGRDDLIALGKTWSQLATRAKMLAARYDEQIAQLNATIQQLGTDITVALSACKELDLMAVEQLEVDPKRSDRTEIHAAWDDLLQLAIQVRALRDPYRVAETARLMALSRDEQLLRVAIEYARVLSAQEDRLVTAVGNGAPHAPALQLIPDINTTITRVQDLGRSLDELAGVRSEAVSSLLRSLREQLAAEQRALLELEQEGREILGKIARQMMATELSRLDRLVSTSDLGMINAVWDKTKAEEKRTAEIAEAQGKEQTSVQQRYSVGDVGEVR